LAFSFADRPGVLGAIAAAVAAAGINIDDVRNPHNPEGTESIAILKVSVPVSDEVVARIAKQIDAKMAAYVHID
jgi:D-3-phosphoglycerate dehydrogenase